MAGDRSLSALASRKWWIYGGGLALILVLRAQVAQSTARVLSVSVVLGLMVLTYTAELWLARDGTAVRPTLLILGFAGIVAGLCLALIGTLPGVLFAAGGLLFLNQAMSGSSELSGESA